MGRKETLMAVICSVLFCCMLMICPQDVSAEIISADGNYVYVETGDGTIQLKDYLGTETVLHIPETIDGKTVKYIDFEFSGVTDLYLPKTVTGCIEDIPTLENIYVDPANTSLFAVDGVLYDNDPAYGITLDDYPSNRAEELFVVPGFVERIDGLYIPKHLKTVVINSNVKHIGLHSIIAGGKVPHDIYFNMDDPTKLLASTDNSILYLADGSRIFVKNEAARQAVQKSVDNTKQSRCGEVEVISLAENPQYAVPAESLSFQDGTTEQDMEMSPNEKKKLTGVSKQLPSNCTECVTWKSSDESIAVIEDNRTVVAKNNGTCDITGENESGMKVVYHLKVYEPVSFIKFKDSRDVAYCSTPDLPTYSQAFDFDEEKYQELVKQEEQKWTDAGYKFVSSPEMYCSLRVYTEKKYFSLSKEPGRAAVSFTSSNPDVAAVTSDGAWGSLWTDYDMDERPAYREVQAHVTATGKPGTAEITATVTDGGNVFTKSFKVQVEEDPYKGNCTRYVELEEFDVYEKKDDSQHTYTFDHENLLAGKEYILYPEEFYRCSTPIGQLQQEWEVDDPQAVQLTRQEDGNYSLTMLKEGTATLTVTIHDRDSVVTKVYPLKASAGKQNSPSGTPGNGGNSSTGTLPGPTVMVPDPVQVSETEGSKDQGSQTTTKISIKKTNVRSVKASGKKALTIRWKKVSGAGGYQIQTSLKKSMKSAKTVTVKKNILTAKVKGLRSGKKYYVRVRAYKTVSGKKYYGKWSAARTGKTK